MGAQAVERGADGIIGMRYATNEVRDGVTEVLAFGTAVSSAAGPVASAPEASSETHVPIHMVTTSNVLPGLSVRHTLGVAQGITVRSSNLVSNIGASFKTLVGG